MEDRFKKLLNSSKKEARTSVHWDEASDQLVLTHTARYALDLKDDMEQHLDDVLDDDAFYAYIEGLDQGIQNGIKKDLDPNMQVSVSLVPPDEGATNVKLTIEIIQHVDLQEIESGFDKKIQKVLS